MTIQKIVRVEIPLLGGGSQPIGLSCDPIEGGLKVTDISSYLPGSEAIVDQIGQDVVGEVFDNAQSIQRRIETLQA